MAVMNTRLRNTRLRKFIGAWLLLVTLTVYALLVMVLAVRILPNASGLVEFLFYAVAGMAWALPAGIIIRWMSVGAAATE